MAQKLIESDFTPNQIIALLELGDSRPYPFRRVRTAEKEVIYEFESTVLQSGEESPITMKVVFEKISIWGWQLIFFAHRGVLSDIVNHKNPYKVVATVAHATLDFWNDPGLEVRTITFSGWGSDKGKTGTTRGDQRMRFYSAYMNRLLPSNAKVEPGSHGALIITKTDFK